MSREKGANPCLSRWELAGDLPWKQRGEEQNRLTLQGTRLKAEANYINMIREEQNFECSNHVTRIAS